MAHQTALRPLLILACLCAPALSAFAGSGPLPEPEVPALGESHKTFLTQVARRTLRDAVLERPAYQPAYVPTAVAEIEAEALVRVRQRGLLLAMASAGPGPLAGVIRDATLTAAKNVADADLAQRERLPDLLIEIEVVGPPQPLPAEMDWSQARLVDPFIEPGLHGLVFLGPRTQVRFCPTELVVSDRELPDVLREVAQQLHGDPSQITATRLLRFRTLHWYQASPGADIVSLERGLLHVPPAAVTARELDEAIEKLADYMIYRQQTSGLFSYQYECGADRYSENNDLVRQIGAVAALAAHARRSKSTAARVAADAGIRFHMQGLTVLPQVPDASFIATADGENNLGVTAMFALALGEHPEPSAHAEVRGRLVRAMLAVQQPSGMLVTAFPPALEIRGQESYAGKALLALAVHHRHTPEAAIADAFDRALGFYRGYFQAQPSPIFVPWQVQAYAIMARQTRRADYAEFVFQLADWLAEKQLRPENCPWPRLHGGIALREPSRPSAATASYLAGFAAALELARFVEDDERARRYESVVREAARFVMQLQIRPEEAYFIRSPQDAVGGLRAAPALNMLRIDHTRHALIGLTAAREVLFPGDHD